MRIRTIKPEWLDDETLVLASPEARVLSIALILLADDYGNGRANLVVLAGRVFPGKNPDVLAKALSELEMCSFVRIYEVGAQRYFAIRNWDKHQRVDKPGKPQVPGFIDNTKVPVTHENIPVIPATDQDQEGTRKGGDLTRAPVREARSEPRPRDPLRQSLAQRPAEAPDRVTIQCVEVTFSELRVEAKRGRYSNPAQRDDERLAHLARFANDGGSTLDERMGVLRACILGYLADDSPNVAKARWPLAFLANDPGRYQAAHEEGSPVPSQASDAVSVARAAYGAACERLQRAEGTPDYDDALDAKRAALATLRRAEAA